MTRTAASIPRVELALGPTPLLKLERLSAELGVELWVKRDDLTGLLESGNKIRKLEFLVGEALAQRADTLITCGTLQSNCCRAASAVAAHLGMRAVLASQGRAPDEYDGNLLLDHLLGAEVHYCDDAAWEHIEDVLANLAAQVRARGGVPYVIPESGATVTGALGYLTCGQELAQQIRHGAPDFDTVAITAFSGGSQAGLLMAQQLAGLRAEIVSVPVAWEGDRACASTWPNVIGGRASPAIGLRRGGAGRTIRLVDGYQGAPAGPRRGGEAAGDRRPRVARREGIVLDPVYTAKAFQRAARS